MSYEVRYITQGLSKGKWGVYKDERLLMAYKSKGAAVKDADERATKEAKGK